MANQSNVILYQEGRDDVQGQDEFDEPFAQERIIPQEQQIEQNPEQQANQGALGNGNLPFEDRQVAQQEEQKVHAVENNGRDNANNARGRGGAIRNLRGSGGIAMAQGLGRIQQESGENTIFQERGRGGYGRGVPQRRGSQWRPYNAPGDNSQPANNLGPPVTAWLQQPSNQYGNLTTNAPPTWQGTQTWQPTYAQDRAPQLGVQGLGVQRPPQQPQS